jgi:DNA-binding response OmpR family regulator
MSRSSVYCPQTSISKSSFLRVRPWQGDVSLGLELGADEYIVKPFSLRELLLEAPQRPLSREHLFQATRNEDILDRRSDVQVLRLLCKLETDPNAPRVIQTERGVGYVFALPVEPF